MRNTLLLILSISLMAFGATEVRGENRGKQLDKKIEKRKPKKWQSRRTRRRLASLNSAQSNSKVQRGRFQRRSVYATLGVSLGYGQTDTNNANRQVERDRSGFHQRGSVGINAVANIEKYLAVDLDGFFVDGPSRNATVVNRSDSSIAAQGDRSLRLFGGQGEVRGRLPIFVSKLKFVPTIGGGFGYLSQKEFQENGTGAQSGSQTNISGPYATAGLGVTYSRLTLSGDYAMSFAASGNTSTIVGDQTASEQDLDDPEFNRIRAGLYYRISVPITLGVQYIRRQLKNTQAGDTAASTETTNQFLSSLVIHF